MLIRDLSTSGYAAPREMGEAAPPPRKPVNSNEFRPREMGERPQDVPSREQQAKYYEQAQANLYTSSPCSNDNYRPREMGEAPVAQPEKQEMTEQERRLDLFA